LPDCLEATTNLTKLPDENRRLFDFQCRRQSAVFTIIDDAIIDLSKSNRCGFHFKQNAVHCFQQIWIKATRQLHSH
jgi:hypothetical protein